MTVKEPYISALGHQSLNRFYDLLISVTIPEKRFKHALIHQASIEPGHMVLDLGTGTATLSILLKQMHPYCEAFALDGDLQILGQAKSKIEKAELRVALQNGMSFSLPYMNETFDRVVSSLMFHHLTTDQKKRTLNEVHRVLKSEGELHIADWGKPQTSGMKIASSIVRIFDGITTTEDNFKGRLPQFFLEAGFAKVQPTRHFATVFGTLSLFRASKPSVEKE